MDKDQFDSLTARLSHDLTRRRGLGALFALGLGAVLVSEDSQAKRKGKRKRKGKGKGNGKPVTPPTPPITCAGKADGADCGEDKQCSGGVCANRQTCGIAYERCSPSGSGAECCSGRCHCEPSSTGPGCDTFLAFCELSENGKLCRQTSDCADGACVGFVCT